LLLMCDPCCKIHELPSPLIDKETSEINIEIDSPKRTLNYDVLHGDSKQNKPQFVAMYHLFFLTEIHLHSGAKKQKKNNKQRKLKVGTAAARG